MSEKHRERTVETSVNNKKAILFICIAVMLELLLCLYVFPPPKAAEPVGSYSAMNTGKMMVRPKPERYRYGTGRLNPERLVTVLKKTLQRRPRDVPPESPVTETY